MRRAFAACAAALTFSAVVAGTAAAQEFYSGKQLRSIVSSAAGGGYDQYARMMQRHMAKHRPTKEMTAEHLKLYETNVTRVLEDLGRLSKSAVAAE